MYLGVPMVVGCNEQRTRIWKLGKGRGREGERGEGDSKTGKNWKAKRKDRIIRR